MLAQKYEEMNNMMQKQIYDLQDALYMKWPHLNRHLELRIYLNYIKKFKRVYIKNFLNNNIQMN